MKKKNKDKKQKREEKEKGENTKTIKKERDEYLEGWKRARADFVNYKKNEAARIEAAKKRVKKDFINDILEILDNFYLAEENMTEDEKGHYSTGFINIRKQFEKLLKDRGVQIIDCEGREFDPNLHEAIAMIDSEKGESDEIAEVVRKGYLLDGELLRPARVKVIK